MTFKNVSTIVYGDDTLITYDNYAVNLKVLVKITKVNEKGNLEYEVVDPAVITYESDMTGRCVDIRSDYELNPYVELRMVNSKELKYDKDGMFCRFLNKNIEYGVVDYVTYHIKDEYDRFVESELKKNNLKRTLYNLTELRARFITNKMNEVISSYNTFTEETNQVTKKRVNK